MRIISVHLSRAAATTRPWFQSHSPPHILLMDFQRRRPNSTKVCRCRPVSAEIRHFWPQLVARRAETTPPPSCLVEGCLSNLGVLPESLSRGHCGGEWFQSLVRVFDRRPRSGVSRQLPSPSLQAASIQRRRHVAVALLGWNCGFAPPGCAFNSVRELNLLPRPVNSSFSW